jgi:hypothetical protein
LDDQIWSPERVPNLRPLAPERLLGLPAPLARRVEVRVLTYAALRAAGALDRLPDDEREAARALYLGTLAYNSARLERLEQALAIARARGVRLVLLKGAAMILEHYLDPGARPMLDVDLACAPADLDRALDALRAAGLARAAGDPVRELRGTIHDLKLTDGTLSLELHFRLWDELRYRGDPTGLLARAVELPLGATRAFVPAPADHLFVLLVHAALHGFAGNPLWLTDAALVAERAGPSVWPEVERLARAEGAGLALSAALDQLALVFPGLVPPARARAAPLRRALLQRLAPWLWRGEPELGLWPSRIVRPLLFERASALARWSAEKLATAAQRLG